MSNTAVLENKSTIPEITLEELNELGYQLTGRQIVPSANARYTIFEVRNDDDKKQVSFCYAFSKLEHTGIILGQSFDEHARKPKSKILVAKE